jgi:hypothetical protein
MFLPENAEWASGMDDHCVVQAEFDFHGRNEGELTVRKGQKINIAPKGIYEKILTYMH